MLVVGGGGGIIAWMTKHNYALIGALIVTLSLKLKNFP